MQRIGIKRDNNPGGSDSKKKRRTGRGREAGGEEVITQGL